jgi:hypothetical protein
MQENKSDLNDEAANMNLENFITYFNDTWVKYKCHFDRTTWNLFSEYSKSQINGQVICQIQFL